VVGSYVVAIKGLDPKNSEYFLSSGFSRRILVQVVSGLVRYLAGIYGA
jgi:hypothetical protein